LAISSSFEVPELRQAIFEKTARAADLFVKDWKKLVKIRVMIDTRMKVG
jgi:hypothetical protein